MIACDFDFTRDQFRLRFKEILQGRGITAITGKSGAGKTTLLRLMLGFERIENATFIVNEKIYQNAEIFIPPEARCIGYVGQTTGLFPFLTAEKNIAFAQKRASTAYAPPNLSEMIDIFDVSHCLKYLPCHLSSGEKQRIAVIQSLVSCPELLLFDEAFSAIDEIRKRIILDYLQDYATSLALPVLYVSHDSGEWKEDLIRIKVN